MTEGQRPLATWGQRAIGEIVDFCITALIGSFLIRLIFGELGYTSTTDALEKIAVALLVVAAYALPLMKSTDGRTLGKRFAQTQVVRLNGQRMNYETAAIREVLAKGLLFGYVATLISLLSNEVGTAVGLLALLDYLWPLWDEKNRALHDFIARTHVFSTAKPLERPTRDRSNEVPAD